MRLHGIGHELRACHGIGLERSARHGGLSVLVALAGVLLLANGCVKEDPIVTGKRDAATDARAPMAPVIPLADLPDDDAPDCRHCSETLSTDTARGTLCRKNGDPSSVRLLNSVVDCVCYDKCIQDCGSYCAGSKQEQACEVCIFQECISFINACVADKKP